MVANSQLQFADPFGLNRIAQPAAQQAQMAQAIKDDQFKALLGTYEPNQYKGLGAMYGTPPQLQTQVEARTVGEGIMKGVGLGLGNLGQQIQYGRRQKAFEDMAAQQQQAQNSQRALIQAQIQAEQERQQRQRGIIPEPLVPAYDVGSPETRALIEKANADARTKSAYAKDIGAATGTEEGIKDVTKLGIGRQGVIDATGIDPFGTPANQGQLPPNVQGMAGSLGLKPQDYLDQRKREAELAGAETGVARNNLQLQSDPVRIKLELESKHLANQGTVLDNYKKQIENYFAEDMGKEKLRELVQNNDIKGIELDKLQRLPEVLDAALTRVQNGEPVDDRQLLEIQTTLNYLAGKDPDFLGALGQVGGVDKKSKKVNLDFLKKPAAPAPSFQQQGNLVQNPKTGNWYDVSDPDNPVAVKAPNSKAPAPVPPATVQPAARPAIQKTAAAPKPQPTPKQPAFNEKNLAPADREAYAALVRKQQQFDQSKTGTSLGAIGTYLGGVVQGGALNRDEDRLLQRLIQRGSR